ncbi:hypothetical protein G8A07_22050 [Roseateles sp. DAIF2]|uniref:hypothetical protein n=1 Tax=Roseateles sp. DAIF2 TaxID=2714952 RepID=UPI0018A2D373|nr:hypothetical protein [Roseateles sp. DAIF2]QPF75339.1 hypothetical protein G8A07_22050 [Roseateles sp. DAIF2]
MKHEIRHSDPLNCTFHHFNDRSLVGQGENGKISNEIKHLEPVVTAMVRAKIVQKEGLADCSASAG